MLFCAWTQDSVQISFSQVLALRLLFLSCTHRAALWGGSTNWDTACRLLCRQHHRVVAPPQRSLLAAELHNWPRFFKRRRKTVPLLSPSSMPALKRFKTNNLFLFSHILSRDREPGSTWSTPTRSYTSRPSSQPQGRTLPDATRLVPNQVEDSVRSRPIDCSLHHNSNNFRVACSKLSICISI